jgi:assimilatory nitrate reductase catalytic subunit
VGAVFPAIEVVENRYGPAPAGDLPSFGVPSLLADQVYHAAAVLGAPVPDAARARLLAGRPQDQAVSEGPRVCACFGVARDAIRHAAVTHRLRTVTEIGVVLRAGTNCGSCIPEIEEILRDVRMPAG